MRIPRLLALFIALGVLVASAVPASAGPVDEAAARMSLKEKVGQLVMFAPTGHYLTPSERDHIHRHKLGGVILFAPNYRDKTQLGQLTSQIQRNVRRAGRQKVGALISVDQEGGPVKRFHDMAPWRSHPQIGATNDTSVAFRQGRMAGRALRAAGVNMNLAPVADLDVGPQRVMRSRSFGSDPRKVGRMVAWFSGGLQSQRTAAVVKHFPGLGAATRNSDFGPSYVYRDRRQLFRADGLPFEKAIDTEAKGVMLSHAMYPNAAGGRPASMNRKIASEWLRGRYGFTGVAVSDGLEAIAWWYRGDLGRTCKATIRAGVDIALVTGGVGSGVACARAIRAAVRSGTISKPRINRATERVLRLKHWLGVFDPN